MGRLIGCVAAFLVCVAGCGSDVDLGEVSGTITMDGKPLEGAYVQFVPKTGGRPGGGVTGADGAYTLTYSATNSGALVGPAKVLITTENPEAGKKETVPPQYNTKTTLEVEVTSGDNVHNFDLTSKK